MRQEVLQPKIWELAMMVTPPLPAPPTMQYFMHAALELRRRMRLPKSKAPRPFSEMEIRRGVLDGTIPLAASDTAETYSA